jgi:hypothetical protein
MDQNELVAADAEIEAYKHQFEQYWEWSKFYHDAEIKMNAGAVAISSLAPFAEKLLGNQGALTAPIFFFQVNLVGIVIIVASSAAIFSTLGYWRYYEYCDIYAKEFRKRYISKSVLKAVKEKADSTFNSSYPVLRRISVNAHHYVWIVVQVLLLCFGFYIAFFKS